MVFTYSHSLLMRYLQWREGLAVLQRNGLESTRAHKKTEVRVFTHMRLCSPWVFRF